MNSPDFKDAENPKIKDIIKTSKSLGMNTVVLFSSTDKFNYVRFAKMLNGPSFTFRALRYVNNE